MYANIAGNITTLGAISLYNHATKITETIRHRILTQLRNEVE